MNILNTAMGRLNNCMAGKLPSCFAMLLMIQPLGSKTT